ncbi:STM4504/CBY_0614 family protein [Fonticella tunisiensis]|uniref:Abortive infection Abi-like protein n=1 Tax=Fonticella tunisiensis TaxID=1096341 RepID=A0A4V3EUC0_9CLOT|nr:hypothetical protein [Fonticella tunisiensis]TDT63345.1 hypothetical protein EDD71_102105 [Fonticella tunisiensis]
MIFELYSKRQKRLNQIEDIFVYDIIPEKLRHQIIHIWNDSINYELWEEIHNIMARELGVPQLSKYGNSAKEKSICFFIQANTEEALDFVELTFFTIDKVIRDLPYFKKSELKMDADSAIEELNYRFIENGIGYEFVNGKIIKIDSKIVHNEIVKPAIKLLYEEEFDGANNEFLKAYEHYRRGNYKESIVEALKSFESTMKTICRRCNIIYEEHYTASKLISILINNGIIPSYLNNHFTGLRTTLESGLPTLRNKTSGHGQGENLIEIPSYFASYAINLTATNIIFLINAFKNYQK